MYIIELTLPLGLGRHDSSHKCGTRSTGILSHPSCPEKSRLSDETVSKSGSLAIDKIRHQRIFLNEGLLKSYSLWRATVSSMGRTKDLASLYVFTLGIAPLSHASGDTIIW